MASTSIHKASSSSSPKWKFDVFLSFRGEDTRKNFVDHLYHAFYLNGIYTFKDDEELRRGEEISPALVKAIEESRIALIVFSKHYASSKWCLDELAKIIECKETMGQTIIPVFYDVDPSQVRKQTGSFAAAFENHQTRFRGDLEKVQRWKIALLKASNISGISVSDTANGHESKCIQLIIEEISQKLNHSTPIVADDLVGIDSRVEEVESLLHMELIDVCSVGLWGMGGIGKTTTAEAVYERISRLFEGSCFLKNVREFSKSKGLEALQERLLSEILVGSNLNITNVGRGANTIKHRLRERRVLVVVDDVDELKQLEALAGKHDWFGSGSRIIITTRDKHLLINYGVTEIYNVKGLEWGEAIQLFSSKAFKQSSPYKSYVELSEHIVRYTGGLPLALKTLGSFLYGRKMDEWEDTLSKLHKNPTREILQVLEISYHGLDKMEKKIFLDIACFFKGKKKDFVTRILKSCDFHSDIGINILVERSLITISHDQFWMHDLVQAMGWYMVRQESEEFGERSRLWLREDVCYVLAENTGTEKVEGIGLELPEPEVVDLNSEAFTKMKKLRLLKVHNVVFSKGPAHLPNELRWLDWHAYPLGCLPPSFQAENLVELCMCCGSINQLWKKIKPLPKLKVINLSHSHRLSRTPDFTVIPNLERLFLEDCTSLVEVHPSIGVLKRLVFLSLKDCKNLKRFPNGLDRLESLETLNLSGCSKLEKFPEIFGDMICLSEIYLDRTAIKELPSSSIEHLVSLTLMDLSECKYLASLPRTICRLSCLKTLILSGCSKLEELPDDLGNIKCLQELHAKKTAIKRLPSSVNLLEDLKVLSLGGCKGTISESFFSSWFLPRKCEDSVCLVLPSLTGLYSLTKLDLSDCNLCEGGIPSDLGSSLPSLKELDLKRNNFVSLPASISRLSQLEVLVVEGCKRLEALPELPSCISRLFADDCQLLVSVGDLSTKYYRSLGTVTFSNCFKLLENKWSTENLVDMILRYVIQRLHVVNSYFCIVLPGREIPEWFRHQYLGSKASVQLPPDWYNERFLGIAACASICDLATGNSPLEIYFRFVDHNNHPIHMISCLLPHREGTTVDSEHIFLSYLPNRGFLPDRIPVPMEWCRVEVYDEMFKTTKWGVRLVYEKELKCWKDDDIDDDGHTRGCGNLEIIDDDGSDIAAVEVEHKVTPLKRECYMHSDDRDHLFYTCPFAQALWRCLSDLLHWHIPAFISPHLFQAFSTWYGQKFHNSKLCLCLFAAVIWGIWHERNARLHGKPPSSPDALARKLFIEVLDVTSISFRDVVS